MSETEAVISSMSFTTKLIILAILLLAGAIYYMYTNVQKFKGSVALLFQNLQEQLVSQAEHETQDNKGKINETESEKEQ
jgi:predicted Holliday junction resolvase-like endonuclease